MTSPADIVQPPDKGAGEHGVSSISHALSVADTLHELEVTDNGLTSEEVASRREHFGANALPSQKQETAVQRLLRQFKDPLIYVLIAAAVLTAVLGEWVDTIVIAAVVVINAGVGFVQEGKAADALAAIRNMLSPEARVLRDGRWRNLDTEAIVPGDVIRLSAGDKVPADMRLLAASNLRIEESALTGESLPAEKSTEPVPENADLGDRQSMVFSGTTAVAGSGTGVVTATGQYTEIGRITRMLHDVEGVETPLTRSMSRFSSFLAIAAVVLAVLMVVVSAVAHGTDWIELMMSAVGFAVAAIPEGLPAVIAITLALGVQKMANRKAITRQLNSVETLGSVTTICTDKTGTLTLNEMSVREVLTLDNRYQVEGTGYVPTGTITVAGTDGPVEVGDYPDLKTLAEVAADVNDASVDKQEDGGWALSGEPTDGGLRTFAMKAGVQESERLGELPFDSEHKYMATINDRGSGPVISLKGAPDRLLERSSHQIVNGERVPLDRDHWDELITSLGSKGLRVLAAAVRSGHPDGELSTTDIDEGGFTFLGLYGIIDPPRDEAIRAVETVQHAGVRVRMITGDHASTAAAIAREVGISGDSVLTGAELENASDEELRELVRTTDVFARTSPEHKLRIVRALQANGEVAAMTGDGVNDAPSLKQADVGVAMGIKGTEATKDAADIVLADDNFATIASAMRMGRTIYDNLRKAIVFMLPTNGAQGLVIFVAMLIGATLPVTALQVLWVNLITSITLSLALSFEPSEPGIMDRPPRDPKAQLLNREAVIRIIYVSALLGAITFWVFDRAIDTGVELEAARTMAVATLAVGQIFYLLSSRFAQVSSVRQELFTTNPISWLCVGLMLLLQLGFTYLPFMNATFDTAPIPLSAWGPPIIIGLGVFLVVEADKAIRRALR